MASFKFVISDKDKSYQVEKDQADCQALMGKKIGDRFSADLLGLVGYELEIRGGSDKDGFPMRPDIEGTIRRRFLVGRGIGFKAKKKIGKKKVVKKGLRKRKMLHGNTIGPEIVQINCKVIKRGEKNLDELLSKKEEKPEAEEEVRKKE